VAADHSVPARLHWWPRALRHGALLLAALYAASAAPIARAADTSLGTLAADYHYCTVCHGATGNGNVAIQAPGLAGIEPWYLASRLRAYRLQQLGSDFAVDPAGTEMRTVARDLGDERLAAIAIYVAALRRETAPQSVPGSASSGRRVYAAQCAACHGTRGEGNETLHAPALARMNDWYVVSAWNRYRSGSRGAEGSDPYAQTMRALAASLGATFAINDVAAYLHSAQPAASR
jgi:cytochrome c oxidase subunit 2